MGCPVGKPWLEVADQWTALAEYATRAGNKVVMIVALQRAAECIRIAKLLDTKGNNHEDGTSTQIS